MDVQVLVNCSKLLSSKCLKKRVLQAFCWWQTDSVLVLTRGQHHIQVCHCHSSVHASGWIIKHFPQLKMSQVVTQQRKSIFLIRCVWRLLVSKICSCGRCRLTATLKGHFTPNQTYPTWALTCCLLISAVFSVTFYDIGTKPAQKCSLYLE